MLTADLNDIELTRIDGRKETLAAYHGKVILIVNVASECGLTPQYEGLQRLYERYADRGLVVLGFPCNQFGGQEPGTHDQIVAFCNARYHVTFPMFEKLEVNGDGRHPLYRSVIAATGGADIEWNFEKFLIARDGTITRFSPRTSPEELASPIESALG